MRLPRFMHCAWANFNGYFWKPCPICGRMFGGHEVTHTGQSWLDGPPEPTDYGWWSSTGVSVCPNCIQEAERRNAAGEYNNVPKKPDVYDLARRLEEVERIMPRMVAFDKWLGEFDGNTPSPPAPPANDAP